MFSWTVRGLKSQGNQLTLDGSEKIDTLQGETKSSRQIATHCQETKESTESASDIMQMLEISERGTKMIIINMLNTPVEKWQHIRTDVQFRLRDGVLRMNQIKMSAIKGSKQKWRMPVVFLSVRLDIAKEWINELNELEDR